MGIIAFLIISPKSNTMKRCNVLEDLQSIYLKQEIYPLKNYNNSIFALLLTLG